MASPTQDTEKALLPGTVLVVAVLGVLGAGAVLSTDSPRASRPVQTGAPVARPAPGPVAVPEAGAETTPAPEPELPPVGESDLAGRVAEDLRRLGASGGRYTAQLVVACKPETVERLIGASAGASDLYLLPAEIKGASCFRLCWGSYATKEQADSAADLPAALRSSDRPRAVEIVSVLP